MKKSLYFWLFLLLLPLAIFAQPKKAVYIYNHGGRLGDQILDYAHAKWISYKWGMQLFFQPFPYSDQFVFHDIEEHYSEKKAAAYTRCQIDSATLLDQAVDSDTLYILTHLPDSFDEYLLGNFSPPYIAIDWSDEKFREMMRALISPKYPLNLMTPPEEIITVALHYRSGKGFDPEYKKPQQPLRFPNPEYYVEQLKTLYNLVGEASLYVYIFTDDPHPEEIKSYFEQRVPFENIVFDCRVKGNHHNANVIEDLFSMMRFDCLIRPVSHYSMTAAHLIDYKIEIYPRNYSWVSHQGHRITDVGVIHRACWNPVQKEWIMKQ